MNCNEHDPVTEHELRNEREIETLRNEVTLLEIENSELIKRNENLEWRIEMMKPHFGQSDAAMNKLAGCNSFPNAGKTFDLTELEQMAREAGCSTPHEYLRQRDDSIQQNIDHAAKGYYGHENGCDCAVCENMHFHELHLNRVAADIEAIKQNAYQAGFNAAKQDCVTILEKMPSRVEPISGQNFTYIKKFVAIDAIQQLGI